MIRSSPKLSSHGSCRLRVLPPSVLPRRWRGAGAAAGPPSGVTPGRSSRAPFAFAASGFVAGVALAWLLQPGEMILWAGIIAVGIALFWTRRKPLWVNLLLIVMMGHVGALRAFYDQRALASSVAQPFSPQRTAPLTCEGVLVSDAEWRRSSYGPAHRQAWVKTAYGRIFVRLPTSGEGLAYGDRILFSGTATGIDQKSWIWRQGGCARVNVSHLEILKPPGLLSIWVRFRRRVAFMKRHVKELGRSLLGQEESGYLESFLLGEREGLSKETENLFIRTGTVHVLVVSGLQVTLLAGIFLAGMGILALPKTLRYLLTIFFLSLYCVVTGASPPIARATVMGILVCLGLMQGQAASALNGLGWAGFILLWLSPRALLDAGFQLSFAAVAGLLLISSHIQRFFGGFSDHPLWRRFSQAVATSCGAWLAVAPFVAWHFHLVTPVALIANLIVVPWVSLMTVCGLLLYVSAAIHPAAAIPVAASFTFLAGILDHLVSFFARLPGGCWTL